MSDIMLHNSFVDGEVCDAFDAFIDSKYVEESESLNNSELFRYCFENELPEQTYEASSSPPATKSSPISMTPPLTNIKMEDTDLELVLRTLLNSVSSQLPTTTEPALLCSSTSAMQGVQSPSVSTSPQPIVPFFDLCDTSKKSRSKSPSRQTRASSLETDLDPNNPDIQKLSSKERRQLRNKISARNFRVRRKEYISTLEAQVQQYQSEVKSLRDSLSQVEDENSKLRSQLAEMRNNFDAHVPVSDLASQPQSPAVNSAEPMVIESAAIRRSDSPFKPTFTVKSGVAPISNGEHFNKDIPNNASSATSARWQDSRVIVH